MKNCPGAFPGNFFIDYLETAARPKFRFMSFDSR